MTETNTSSAVCGLVAVHELWKSDRTKALDLLGRFHASLTGYEAAEMVDMAHLGKRFDRQNNTTGGGAPTSVWTSVIVNVDAQGAVSEGRLSELYPHGVAVPTYDFPKQGLSAELIAADLAAVMDADNKTNAQGEDTAYEGKTWRAVVGDFLGQALELAKDSPAPEGFVLVPIEHKQPPMVQDGAYTPLDLFWRSKNDGVELTNASLTDVGKHIFGFNCVLTGEYIDGRDQVEAAVRADENYKSEVAQLAALIEAGSK